MTDKSHFLYQFVPTDRPELMTDPEAWTERDEQIAAEHYQYLLEAREKNVLIFAGRSLDGIGPAVVVFEAASKEAARTFMQGDPFVREGLFGAELHPFRAALVREPGK